MHACLAHELKPISGCLLNTKRAIAPKVIHIISPWLTHSGAIPIYPFVGRKGSNWHNISESIL
jgi:hypothetical protein